MNQPTRQAITASILKWLPRGILLDENESNLIPLCASGCSKLIIVQWLDGNSFDVTTVMRLESDFVQKIQNAIESEQPNLLESYLGLLEDYIVFRAVAQDGGDVQNVWRVTADVLS